VKLLFVLIFLFSQVKPGELIIAPTFYGTYHSEGNVWKSNNDYTALGGWGIVSKYKINRLSIKLDFYNNRFYNLNKRPNYFSKDQVYLGLNELITIQILMEIFLILMFLILK